ncbi:MAG: DinB family protein [Desulfobacterales bacterium]
MERLFVADNARELDRLRALTERLTDEELIFPIGNGWTIAVALAHLAFWDQRALFLLRKWKKDGVEASPIDIDITNDALLPLWLAVPPRKAANLAISSAEAIDRELEEAPTELINEIVSLGEKFRLYRSFHRKQHLDEIEEYLNDMGKAW